MALKPSLENSNRALLNFSQIGVVGESVHALALSGEQWLARAIGFMDSNQIYHDLLCLFGKLAGANSGMIAHGQTSHLIVGGSMKSFSGKRSMGT